MWQGGYSGDGGNATAAQLSNPDGIALDAVGNLYIADYGNSRIRKVNTSGIISSIAGNGTTGFSGDGGQATNAGIGYPWGVSLDASGNLYIADGNSRIRKVTNVGQAGIQQVAGNNMQVTVYPNPANTMLNLTLRHTSTSSVSAQGTKTTIYMYDMIGNG